MWGNRRRSESGQAAVEAALTLPLTVFLVLGTLQLFLMLQARLMAEHAAFRTVRIGSLSQGSCERMMHAAITTLLPTLARTDGPVRLAQAFNARKGNQFVPSLDMGHNGDIVWLIRGRPLHANLPAGDDHFFDNPDVIDTSDFRLELRLVYWFPLKIPFANWVISRIALAHLGLQSYNGYDPLHPTGHATGGGWQDTGAPKIDTSQVFAGKSLFSETLARTDNPAGTYVFPIQATAAMRMMTPARRANFSPQHCR